MGLILGLGNGQGNGFVNSLAGVPLFSCYLPDTLVLKVVGTADGFDVGRRQIPGKLVEERLWAVRSSWGNSRHGGHKVYN